MSDETVTKPVMNQPRGGDAEALPPPALIEDVDIDYKLALERFKDRALFVDGVRREVLSKTRPSQWLGRTGKDGTKTFDLMAPGAERIKTYAPIGFANLDRREESWRKEHGEGYTIYYTAEVYLGDKRNCLPVIGSCSSDDDFFSLEHVEFDFNPDNPEHAKYMESGEGRLTQDKKKLYVRRRIPASEVTKENIEKSALANLTVNGVTRILGIRKMTLEELKEVGVNVEQIASVDYGSKRDQSGRLAPHVEQKREEIKRMLIEMAGGDDAKALADLKGRTAFKDYQGCQSWDRLTEGQVTRHFDKIKADYDKFREGAPQGGAPAEGKGAAKGAKPAGGQKGGDAPPPGNLI